MGQLQLFGPTNLTLSSSMLGSFNVYTNNTLYVNAGNGFTFGGNIDNRGTISVQLATTDEITFTRLNNSNTINIVSGTVFLLVFVTLYKERRPLKVDTILVPFQPMTTLFLLANMNYMQVLLLTELEHLP